MFRKAFLYEKDQLMILLKYFYGFLGYDAPQIGTSSPNKEVSQK